MICKEMYSLAWKCSNVCSQFLRNSGLNSVYQTRNIHGGSCLSAMQKPTVHRKSRELSKENENEWHRELGSWSEKNKMLYPPLNEGEGRRPAEIYHGRAKIRYPVKKLLYISHLVRNMNIDEALSRLSYINNKAAKVVHAVLLETQELAVTKHNVEFKSNLHIVESFACQHSIIPFMIFRAMGRMPARGSCRFSNYYVMVREGPSPPRFKITALESALEYVANLRKRTIIDGL